MKEQYVETPDGLDVSNFWTREGSDAVKAAGEAIVRFDQPAMSIKDIIDNPDLNQHQSEVAVAYITGCLLGSVVNQPRDPFSKFFEAILRDQ